MTKKIKMIMEHQAVLGALDTIPKASLQRTMILVLSEHFVR
jgi:hypothetical protein